MEKNIAKYLRKGESRLGGDAPWKEKDKSREVVTGDR